MKPDTWKTFLLCFFIVFVPLMFALLVSPGCSKTEPTAESGILPEAKTVEVEGRKGCLPNRFSVASYGTFWAGGPYSNKQREILVVKDKETGVEYLAITGCGTSELVPSGKTLQEE